MYARVCAITILPLTKYTTSQELFYANNKKKGCININRYDNMGIGGPPRPREGAKEKRNGH